MSAPFKRGMDGYVTMLWLLKGAPATSRELARRVGVSNAQHADLLMRRLWEQEIVHVGAWSNRAGPGCWPHPIWAFGPGVDVAAPPRWDGKPHKGAAKAPMRVEAYTFGLIVKALEDGSTVRALLELLGGHYATLAKLLVRMRELGLAHVAEWNRASLRASVFVPVYRWGEGVDKSRPRPKSRREVQHTYRQHTVQRRQCLRLIRRTAAPIAQPFPLAA